MKKLFLIIGAPGSGKTTDAELIAKSNENISHYSTGDMLRAEVVSCSDLGKKIDTFISKGLIVPINIVINTILNAIKSAPTDVVILDGYPRSIQQMDKLSEYLKNDSSVELIYVVEVKVSEETARERVLGRARGDDDSKEVFNNRMKVYTEPLAEIENFYKKTDNLKVISGEGTVEEIVVEMETFINANI